MFAIKVVTNITGNPILQKTTKRGLELERAHSGSHLLKEVYKGESVSVLLCNSCTHHVG